MKQLDLQTWPCFATMGLLLKINFKNGRDLLYIWLKSKLQTRSERRMLYSKYLHEEYCPLGLVG